MPTRGGAAGSWQSDRGQSRGAIVALMVLAAIGGPVSAAHAGPGIELNPNGVGPAIASVEAETWVAGAFLMSPRRDKDELDRAQQLLDPTMFSRRDLGLVFTSAAALRLRGVQPDRVTVAEDLRSRGQFDDAGGYELLDQLVEEVPTAANVEYHAKIVRQKAAARTYRTMLRTALRDVEQAERPLADILREHGDRVDSMSRAQGAQDTDAPVFTTLSDLMARPELLSPPDPVVPRIAYRGRLLLVAAPDKSGKTSLLANVSGAVAREGHFAGEPVCVRHGRVVWLGLEEALGDAVRRFAEMGVDGDRVQLVSLQVPDLLARTRALLEAWPADLVVVDSLSEYARVTLGEVPEDGDTGSWAGVVRPLVSLARDRDVAVVVLHHVRRSDGQYRGSGEIAAAADALLEMSMPRSGEDPTLRRFTGRGRWAVEPFSLVLRDGQYEASGGAELSLDARLLLHIESEPGQSQLALCRVVGARKQTVVSALNRLVERGAVRDRGDGRGSAYYPTSTELDLEDL